MNIGQNYINSKLITSFPTTKQKAATLPLQTKPQSVGGGSRGLEALSNYGKAGVNIDRVKAKLVDEIVKNDPDARVAFDAAPNNALREEMRERILSQCGLCDEHLQVKEQKPPLSAAKNQLPIGSKYYNLGGSGINKKTGKSEYYLTNLRQAPDNNGLRGKTILNGKSKGSIAFRLNKLKQNGINTVIDFRSEGECSKRAKEAIDEIGLKYLNFPVEDKNWSKEAVEKIGEYIKAVNEGDFFAGCANGEARTDLAMAINYIFNKDAKNIPEFYFGTASGGRVSVKGNISKILDCVSKTPEMVKQWGFENYDEFLKHTSQRLSDVIKTLYKG